MKYKLPRGYLSYSAMSLWDRSKDQYRMKYYGSEAYDLETVYTRFGKYIAETLEDKEKIAKHPVLSRIPTYAVAEHPVEHPINGVPIKAYIDSFDPDGKRILEYKTGIKTRDGEDPWDRVKVRKHMQLLLYSLLIQDRDGYVDPTTTLVWLETCWKEKCSKKKFGKRMYKVCGPELDLTGNFKIFERVIEPWEHTRMRTEIERIASEISEDYSRYLSFSTDKNIQKTV